MLNPKARLTYNQSGQAIEFYPPEWPMGYILSAGTYAVHELDASLDDTPLLNGTASLDSTAKTFASNSGPSQTSNRDRCNLNSNSQIVVGRYYLATADSTHKRSELIKVAAIGAIGAWVGVEGQLENDYENGDGFWGIRQAITGSSLDTFLADENNIGKEFKVVWTYAIAGVTYKRVTYFELVRLQSAHGVTKEDLYRRYPDLVYNKPHSMKSNSWSWLFEEAERRVNFDLQTKFGATVDQVRTEHLNHIILQAAIWVLSESWHPQTAEASEFRQDSRIQYYADLNSLEKIMPVDKGSEGATTGIGKAKPYFIR